MASTFDPTEKKSPATGRRTPVETTSGRHTPTENTVAIAASAGGIQLIPLPEMHRFVTSPVGKSMLRCKVQRLKKGIGAYPVYLVI